MSGREPTFLLQPVEFFERPAGQRFLRVDLERIRGAAERVALSEGLEVVDVEWKIGKQRFLRVYIDRPWPPAPKAGAEAAGPKEEGISHADCQRVSQQLSVILDVEDLVPGPG